MSIEKVDDSIVMLSILATRVYSHWMNHDLAKSALIWLSENLQKSRGM
jgi:hypothetical protein